MAMYIYIYTTERGDSQIHPLSFALLGHIKRGPPISGIEGEGEIRVLGFFPGMATRGPI